MRTYITAFPNDIDSRSFMSDIDLENLDLFEQYQNLIKREMYGDAASLLERSYISFYYGAYLFNMLEDRLHKIGEYLIAKDDKEPLGYYQSELISILPKNAKNGMYWID